jgi:hypothetical protein
MRCPPGGTASTALRCCLTTKSTTRQSAAAPPWASCWPPAAAVRAGGGWRCAVPAVPAVLAAAPGSWGCGWRPPCGGIIAAGRCTQSLLASRPAAADPQAQAAAWRRHPLITRWGLRLAVLPAGECLAADMPSCGEGEHHLPPWHRLALQGGRRLTSVLLEALMPCRLHKPGGPDCRAWDSCLPRSGCCSQARSPT